jgi:large subunit ribosomal protein L21
VYVCWDPDSNVPPPVPQAEEGSTIQFGRVLMYKGESGVQFGTPYLESVNVEGEVVEHMKGDKIIIYKMKIKKHYRRKNGHRQSLTKFMITKIDAAPSEAPSVTPEEVKRAAARAPEDKRAAVEELLTTGDSAAAVRITLRVR